MPVAVAKAILFFVTGQDVLFLHDTPIEITIKIDKGFLIATEALAVDHPFSWVVGLHGSAPPAAWRETPWTGRGG